MKILSQKEKERLKTRKALNLFAYIEKQKTLEDSNRLKYLSSITLLQHAKINQKALLIAETREKHEKLKKTERQSFLNQRKQTLVDIHHPNIRVRKSDASKGIASDITFSKLAQPTRLEIVSRIAERRSFSRNFSIAGSDLSENYTNISKRESMAPLILVQAENSVQNDYGINIETNSHPSHNETGNFIPELSVSILDPISTKKHSINEDQKKQTHLDFDHLNRSRTSTTSIRFAEIRHSNLLNIEDCHSNLHSRKNSSRVSISLQVEQEPQNNVSEPESLCTPTNRFFGSAYRRVVMERLSEKQEIEKAAKMVPISKRYIPKPSSEKSDRSRISYNQKTKPESVESESFFTLNPEIDFSPIDNKYENLLHKDSDDTYELATIRNAAQKRLIMKKDMLTQSKVHIANQKRKVEKEEIPIMEHEDIETKKDYSAERMKLGRRGSIFVQEEPIISVEKPKILLPIHDHPERPKSSPVTQTIEKVERKVASAVSFRKDYGIKKEEVKPLQKSWGHIHMNSVTEFGKVIKATQKPLVVSDICVEFKEHILMPRLMRVWKNVALEENLF